MDLQQKIAQARQRLTEHKANRPSNYDIPALTKFVQDQDVLASDLEILEAEARFGQIRVEPQVSLPASHVPSKEKLQSRVEGYGRALAKLETQPGNYKFRRTVITYRSQILAISKGLGIPAPTLAPITPLPSRKPVDRSPSSTMERMMAKLSETMEKLYAAQDPVSFKRIRHAVWRIRSEITILAREHKIAAPEFPAIPVALGKAPPVVVVMAPHPVSVPDHDQIQVAVLAERERCIVAAQHVFESWYPFPFNVELIRAGMEPKTEVLV